MNRHSYENFPAHLVLICATFSLIVYGIGAYLLGKFGMVFMGAYLLYCLWMEWRVLAYGCRDCIYYGKWCAFGKGKLCALLFRPGVPERFNARTISWRDMLPDLLVALVPFIAGLVLLVRDFSWIVLALVLALAAHATIGNGFIRGGIACKYCRQRECGCPAERLFDRAAGKSREQVFPAKGY
jgi:hypothetical protein